MRNLVTISFLLACGSCAGFPQQQAPVTPQRPLLSINPDTTAAGTLEVESGMAIDPDDSFRWPTTVKWGMAERTELFASTSLWTHLDANGADGPEDLQLGLRQRLLDEDETRPGVAVQVKNQLPTGNDQNGLGSGGTQVFFAGTASKHFGAERLTAFYQLGLLDDPNGGRPDLEHDLALALSHGLDEQWSLFGELGGVIVNAYDYNAAFTNLGARYAVNQFLTLDVGVEIGLSPDAPDFQLLFGGSWNLGGFSGK